MRSIHALFWYDKSASISILLMLASCWHMTTNQVAFCEQLRHQNLLDSSIQKQTLDNNFNSNNVLMNVTSHNANNLHRGVQSSSQVIKKTNLTINDHTSDLLTSSSNINPSEVNNDNQQREWLFESDDLSGDEGKHLSSFSEFGSERSQPTRRNSTTGHSRDGVNKHRKAHRTSHKNISSTSSNHSSSSSNYKDDDFQHDSSTNGIFDESEESEIGMAGVSKSPECATKGRYYCTYKEDYPVKLVTETAKYYKWPLEKLFRDLHAQIMPKLAPDSTGNLVCDSMTRVIRPGWARNTNDRWLVVINTENYHQYVTEVVCLYGTNSRCNFIPPCYYSSCQQRYNTQKLLVIDPSNPYRGPFLSEFLFPSCCVCYVPSISEGMREKYRPEPTTIFQRTLTQEAASNLYPPQLHQPRLLTDQVNNEIHLMQNSNNKLNNADQTVGSIKRSGDSLKLNSLNRDINLVKPAISSSKSIDKHFVADNLRQ